MRSTLWMLGVLTVLGACNNAAPSNNPPPGAGVPCAYFSPAGNDFYGKPFNGATTQPLVPSEPVANGFGFTTCRGTFVSGTKTVDRTLSFFFSTDNLQVGQRIYTRVNYQEVDRTVNCPSATCSSPSWFEDATSSYIKIESLVGKRLRFSFDKLILNPNNTFSSASGHLSMQGDITVTLPTP